MAAYSPRQRVVCAPCADDPTQRERNGPTERIYFRPHPDGHFRRRCISSLFCDCWLLHFMIRLPHLIPLLLLLFHLCLPELLLAGLLLLLFMILLLMLPWLQLPPLLLLLPHLYLPKLLLSWLLLLLFVSLPFVLLLHLIPLLDLLFPPPTTACTSEGYS